MSHYNTESKLWEGDKTPERDRVWDELSGTWKSIDPPAVEVKAAAVKAAPKKAKKASKKKK